MYSVAISTIYNIQVLLAKQTPKLIYGHNTWIAFLDQWQTCDCTAVLKFTNFWTDMLLFCDASAKVVSSRRIWRFLKNIHRNLQKWSSSQKYGIQIVSL